jgi:hypothetical protein
LRIQNGTRIVGRVGGKLGIVPGLWKGAIGESRMEMLEDEEGNIEE